MNPQYQFFPYNPNNIEQRLNNIEYQLKEINDTINKLLETKKNNYLQKDDNLYML